MPWGHEYYQKNKLLLTKLYAYKMKILRLNSLTTRLAMVVMILMSVCNQASAQESYAVFKDGTLTFKHDAEKPADAYALNTGENAPAWATDYKDQIKTVVFEASFANARPTSCCSWFKNQKLLTKIEGIKNLNTENVKTMNSMFTSCFTLKTVDVSHFNTQNLTNMYNMFASCTSLTTIDLSNFDTKKVTTMTQLFINCKNLTTIYASDKFVTTTLLAGKDKDMFKSCAKLKGAIEFDPNEIGKTHANFEGYFTRKVAEESYAVFADGVLTFKHDGAKPAGAYEIKGKPTWSAANITKVVFEASFAEARPTSCNSWFNGCTKLATIEGIEYLNTEKVTDMAQMFNGCAILKSLDLSHFNTQIVKNMYNMLNGCQKLTTLDLSNFDTHQVTSMGNMFKQCKALKTIYASDKFVTTGLAEGKGEYMFTECYSLKGAIAYDKTKVNKDYANFKGYFTAPTPTGIDQIVVPTTYEAEYYDLQGRRLSQPQKGINIVKRGNKTQKILVK